MPRAPLIAAMLVLVSGSALASGVPTSTPDAPPAPQYVTFRVFVDGMSLLVFQNGEAWIEHREGPKPTGTAYLNGRPWRPVFPGDYECPCPSTKYALRDGGAPRDPALEVRHARTEVRLVPDDAHGVLAVVFDDRAIAGGDWYDVAIHAGRSEPRDREEDTMTVRFLVDHFLVLALSGREGWVEVTDAPRPSGHILEIDGRPIKVEWNESLPVAGCFCASRRFQVFDARDEGVPADAKGAVYSHDGRGRVFVVEQPADGNGVFRLGVDDAPHANPAWYTIAIGPDPTYEFPRDRERCYDRPYPDGAYPAGARPCGPREGRPDCGRLPEEAASWSEDMRRAWSRVACSGLVDETTARDAARRLSGSDGDAATNASGERIVVPGAGGALLLAGLGAAGVVVGRRRG